MLAVVKIFLILLFILLVIGCGGNTSQSNSQNISQINLQALPRLFIQPKANSDPLVVMDIGANTTSERSLILTTTLTLLLSEEYQVVGDMLVGQGEQFFSLTSGVTSPNGLWLATINDDGLHLFRLDGKGVLLSANGQFPVWSPDGQWLAYQDDTGLWGVAISNLTPQQFSTTSIEPLAWSADNQQLLLRSGETVTIFNVTTQQERILRNINGSQLHNGPVWAVDGLTIYARYGNNGRLQSGDVQARLVAITIGRNNKAMLRDLAPNVRNRGVTTFLPSPDGTMLVARYFICRRKFGGLIPFIPTRTCTGALLLVESANGNYQTLPESPPVKALAWEQLSPPVNLADLPLPVAPTTSATLNHDSFWQPAAMPGYNPATAVPLGKVGQAENRGSKLLSVVAVVHGEGALDLAVKANIDPPMLPPNPGYTYLAVHQRITKEAGKSNLFISPNTLLVDDRLVAHREVLWLNMAGQVITQLEYSADAPADYWQLFVIEENAAPWLLFIPAKADNWPDLYFRLDEKTDWVAPQAIARPLPVNDVGVAKPAKAGETAVSAIWQVTVLDPNQTEWPSPPAGLVKVKVAYTGNIPSTKRLFTCLSNDHFQGVAGAQVARSSRFKRQNFQNYYRDPCFLPGAVFSGWLIVQPGVEEERAVFRFTPPQNISFGERSFVK